MEAPGHRALTGPDQTRVPMTARIAESRIDCRDSGVRYPGIHSTVLVVTRRPNGFGIPPGGTSSQITENPAVAMRFAQRKAGGMFQHRTIGWFCFVSVAAIFGCGPIPEDTANNPTTESDGGRVYSNDEWGFRITVPDVWGWTAQTSFQAREPNGLPRVEVVMNREAIGGFEAVLTLRPRALSENSTLQTVTAELEEEFKSTFLGYRAQEKRTFQISGRDGIEWVFRTVFLRRRGDRFFVTVVLDGRKAYLMMGNGTSAAFPVDEYRSIASSLEFR